MKCVRICRNIGDTASLMEQQNRSQIHDAHPTHVSKNNKIEILEDTMSIPVERGVRQGDPMPPKLFIMTPEDMFKSKFMMGRGKYNIRRK